MSTNNISDHRDHRQMSWAAKKAERAIEIRRHIPHSLFIFLAFLFLQVLNGNEMHVA